MDLLRLQCNSCGNFAADLDSGQCQHCGGSDLQQRMRCSWCSQWSAAKDYCEHCGSVIASEEKYGPSRMLKQKGIDKVSISIELDKYSKEEIKNLQDEFHEHGYIATQLINIARFCAQFLYNPDYHFEFEDRLVKDLPFEADIFEHLKKSSLPKEETVGKQLAAIAASCKLQELSELATIASVKFPEAITDSEGANKWLKKVTAVALSEGINSQEALIALAHWRSWVEPFCFDLYQGELGKNLYNTTHSKLLNSEGDKKIWFAALCAKTEIFQNQKETNQNKADISNVLKTGLGVDDPELRLSCAIILNDENTYASLANSDVEEIRLVVLQIL